MKKNWSFLLLIIFCIHSDACEDASHDFNRNPAHIHYSKHARCRMGCRHVDEAEVKEILAKGNINFSKSELNQDACHKRYALEGTSHDQQRLRIIVAECNNNLTVITVIDLGRDWKCDCE